MLSVKLPPKDVVTCHTEEDQKNCDVFSKMSNELTALQGSQIKYNQVLLSKENDKNSVIGPYEKILNESLSELNVNQERYFNGDAMVGNRECNIYKAIKNGDYSITKCFEEFPEVRKKFNNL